MIDLYNDLWYLTLKYAIFFGCNDPMTAEFIAKKIGKTTIETAAISESIGTQKRSNNVFGDSSLQSGNSRSETGRDILMPDEIQRLGNNVVLVFNAGEKPILCSRINYFEREEWAKTWDINPLHENRNQDQKYTLEEYGKMAWQVLTS